MKARSCKSCSDQREIQRLHYCGTCKTIGRLYGQKARLFLNHDAVFLGELLMTLEAPKEPFAPAFLSRNCFALPSNAQLPWAFQYAATTNVVLAQFKLLDHIADTGSRLVRLTTRLYSKEFRNACRVLKGFQFPLDQLYAQISLQAQRENEARPQLDRLAEPTANATQLVFEHGARRAGMGAETTATMARLGSEFGQIAYLADAIQDQDKDAKDGAFNALAATGATRADGVGLLKIRQREMLDLLRRLPIPDDRRAVFSSRLRVNLAPLVAGEVLAMGGRQPSGPIFSRTVRSRRGPSEGGCCDPLCTCCGIECCCNCAPTCCCDLACCGCN